MIGINKKGNRAIIIFQRMEEAKVAANLKHKHLKIQLKSYASVVPSEQDEISNGSDRDFSSKSTIDDFIDNSREDDQQPDEHKENIDTDENSKFDFNILNDKSTVMEEKMRPIDQYTPARVLNNKTCRAGEKNDSKYQCKITHGTSENCAKGNEKFKGKKISNVKANEDNKYVNSQKITEAKKTSNNQNAMISLNACDKCISLKDHYQSFVSQLSSTNHIFHTIQSLIKEDSYDSFELSNALKQLQDEIDYAIKFNWESENALFVFNPSSLMELQRKSLLQKNQVVQSEMEAMKGLLKLKDKEHQEDKIQWSKEYESLSKNYNNLETKSFQAFKDLRVCRSKLACSSATVTTFKREKMSLLEEMANWKRRAQVLSNETNELKARLKEMEKIVANRNQHVIHPLLSPPELINNTNFSTKTPSEEEKTESKVDKFINFRSELNKKLTLCITKNQKSLNDECGTKQCKIIYNSEENVTESQPHKPISEKLMIWKKSLEDRQRFKSQEIEKSQILQTARTSMKNFYAAVNAT